MSNYIQGVLFLLLSIIVSCANDVLSKFMGQRLPAAEIIFFRFLFGFITLLPLVIVSGTKILHTRQLSANIIRGVLGAVSLFLCTYAVITLPLVEVTVILWTIPLFQLVLARAFLGEKVTLLRWIATIIGFIGLSCVAMYDGGRVLDFNPLCIVPIAAAILFAVQDVMIKKIVTNENRITMLLYFAAVATIVSALPAMMQWIKPDSRELLLLAGLGLGGNLIQYFIFRAFKAADLSALAPYRYTEFFVSATMAFLFFEEIPGINVLMGAAILVPSTLYLGYSERRRAKKNSQS